MNRISRISLAIITAVVFELALITQRAGASEPSVRPTVDPEWASLNFRQFADVAIAKACSSHALQIKQTPPEVISFAWDQYLSNSEQIHSADPASMFKMMSAVLTKLTPSQKAKFTQTYYHEVLQTGRDPKDVDPSHLVLIGWALISSGLYNQNQSFPEFATAIAYQVSKHDEFYDCVRRLQGVPADTISYTTAMRTYLNPFWYDQIRKTIDDNACPFYHALYSDSDLARDYSATYFFGKALGTEKDRDIVRAKLMLPCGCPSFGTAKVLTWSYKRLGQLDQWKTTVDNKLKDTSLPGDATSHWLMVRGYIEEAADYSPNAWKGIPWFKRALAATKEHAVQTECLEAVVERYIEVGLYDNARSTLNAARPSLTSDSTKSRFKRLENLIDVAQARWHQILVQKHLSDEEQLQAGQVRLLESVLAEGKARGDSPTHLASLEKALTEARDSLNKLQAATQP